MNVKEEANEEKRCGEREKGRKEEEGERKGEDGKDRGKVEKEPFVLSEISRESVTRVIPSKNAFSQRIIISSLLPPHYISFLHLFLYFFFKE